MIAKLRQFLFYFQSACFLFLFLPYWRLEFPVFCSVKMMNVDVLATVPDLRGKYKCHISAVFFVDATYQVENVLSPKVLVLTYF